MTNILQNRMWRKNRESANHSPCSQWGVSDDLSNGIDLNRNFGYLWMSKLLLTISLLCPTSSTFVLFDLYSNR